MGKLGFTNLIIVLLVAAVASAMAYFILHGNVYAPTSSPIVLPPVETSTPPVPATDSSSTPSSTSYQPPGAPGPYTTADLKYFVRSAVGGTVTFCGPPVERIYTHAEYNQQFSDIRTHYPGEFQSVLKHLGLNAAGPWTEDQKQRVIQEHKILTSIQFVPQGYGYGFSLRTRRASEGEFVVQGHVTSAGGVSISSQQAYHFSCPICLSGGMLIDTPRGAVAVADMQVGMPVWTVDAAGIRMPAVVLEAVRVAVPDPHGMIRVTLSDGRQLLASPAHPTADGRYVGALAPGDALSGARVVNVEETVTHEQATYDILPSGPTGFYFANGILVGSTRKKD